jgi:hypothetical protein
MAKNTVDRASSQWLKYRRSSIRAWPASVASSADLTRRPDASV